MAIKTAESGVCARVGRVSRNTGIFFGSGRIVTSPNYGTSVHVIFVFIYSSINVPTFVKLFMRKIQGVQQLNM